MNILHIAPLTSNKSSGIVNIVPKIVEEQNKQKNINSSLLNVFNNKTEENYNFDYFDYRYASDFENYFLLETTSNIDIVVFHSFFILKYIKIAKLLKKHKIPYIVFPHGALMKEAIKSKYIKKTVANHLFFNNFVKNASMIQFLSEGEKNKSLEFNVPSCVIPNGLSLPQKTNVRNFVESNQVNFTFIGRLDIKTKGIDKLLEVINILHQHRMTNKNLKFNIFGPDENGSVKYINEYLNERKLNDIVEISGSVYGDEKIEAYLNTDIFIQLSRNEGLPTGILEALSYGIPAIVSEGTNLGDIIDQKCGWKAEVDSLKLANQINSIVTDTSSKKFNKLKNHAIKIVEMEYSWKFVTETSIALYTEILNKYKED